MTRETRDYVPALCWGALPPFYDGVVRALTREAFRRSVFVDQLAPRAGEKIFDVGWGISSLAVLLKRAAAAARIVGLDPDQMILDRAAAKTKAAGAAMPLGEISLFRLQKGAENGA